MESTSTIEALADKFQAHRQSQFTGVVHIGVSKAPQWSIYFHLGRMVWAHARSHPIRRWHRQIVKHCPQLITAVTHTAAGGTQLVDYAALHYSKLVGKVRKGEVSRIDIAKAVEDYLSEILFDIIHQGVLRKLQAKPDFTLTDAVKEFSSDLFLVVRAEQAWQQAQYDWQAWQLAELVKCSPNLAPVIGQSEALKQKTSEAVYQHLISIIDGQRTFRDLSVQLDQPLLPLTRRIVPYIRQGVMGVTRVDDLANPKAPVAPPKPGAKPIQTQPSRSAHTTISKASSSAPLIIYIDDSPMDSKIMGNILQDAGYRFRNIQESAHALPLLIEHKPQLIFLDLVMPIANGYEICTQVRRISMFKETPIVIVTSNSSIADRVHAKVVGASGFLNKPIQREKVLKTVQKLLSEQAVSV